jgi:peptidoglycan/LPS O-acetylase OafA/YrhL
MNLLSTNKASKNVANSPKPRLGQRLTWLEGIRMFAALLILVYHYQLLFSDYAFAPQPTGIAANLARLWQASQRFGMGWGAVGSLPGWFGYQFVDVFVLISGFSLVLSLKGQPLQVGRFLKQRLLRILWPFWVIAWLSYPVLCAIGFATNTYIPRPWNAFAGMSFPLLYEYGGHLLLSTSGPWWFLPLIMSFAAMFPVLWHLKGRWGIRNVLWVTILVTLGYRALAVYGLGGHPTYVMFATSAGWQPFVPFIAKLGTFAMGMWAAICYLAGRGPLWWTLSRSLAIGIPVYAVGFICQFYTWGWIIADSLIAIGLSLICMAVFRGLTDRLPLGKIFKYLGRHSYSYFLIHNFVIDRLIRLVIRDDLSAYYFYLPIAVVGTFGLAIAVDAVTPKIENWVTHLWQRGDRYLSRSQMAQNLAFTWHPSVGETVNYGGSADWEVLQIEEVTHRSEQYQHVYRICQIQRGSQTLWVNQQDLYPLAQGQRSSIR